VAPIITGKIIYFMFRASCISIHIFLYYYCIIIIIIIIITYGRLTKKKSVSAILFCKNGEVIGMKVKKAGTDLVICRIQRSKVDTNEAEGEKKERFLRRASSGRNKSGFNILLRKYLIKNDINR
jgi:hypothetical protein